VRRTPPTLKQSRELKAIQSTFEPVAANDARCTGTAGVATGGSDDGGSTGSWITVGVIVLDAD